MRLPNTSRTLFLKLNENTYFVLGTQWIDGALCNNYHLLRVVPSAIIPITPNEEIPKAFLKTEVLIEIDAKMAFDQLSGSITGMLTTSSNHTHLIIMFSRSESK